MSSDFLKRFSSDAGFALASLPWYDLAEVRHATDALWRGLARKLRREGVRDVPVRLNRDLAYDQQWSSSGFLFGQACGYDVRIAHADRLRVVATPSYVASGCRQNNYSSFVVVREDSKLETLEDLRGTRCVINTPTSHSGMNVLRALVAPLHCEGRFFAKVRVSGSHRQSLRMIQQSDVDVAAIDCVTHALLARHRPDELVGSRVLHRTAQVPAPPYVTAASTSVETLARLRSALLQLMDDPSVAWAREELLLSDVEVLPEEAYRPIEWFAAMAESHNYGELPGLRHSYS